MSSNWNINTRLDSNGGQQPRQYFAADDVNTECHACLNHVLNFILFLLFFFFVLRYMFTGKTWRKPRYELVSKRWTRGVTARAPLTSVMDGGKRSVKPSCVIHWVAATAVCTHSSVRLV